MSDSIEEVRAVMTTKIEREKRNAVIEECARRIREMTAYSAEEISFKEDAIAEIKALKS